MNVDRIAVDAERNENLRSALDDWSVEAGGIDEASVAEAAAVLGDSS
ncbi:hypothetical protein AADG42_12915 [Ammonicoccus fulvus]|uniref:Uncharacterized protein n=1 Tax=Ammonicoccus fulvus TaxID=3138240 RepID=A0ABZ3FSL4_9ACTN